MLTDKNENTVTVTQEEPLLALNGIYKIYGEGLESEVRALDGVDLRIMRGEYVAIIGASGSGKSTLMNILGCLDQPTYGDYLLNGELVSEMDDMQLSQIRNRTIGFIFQGFNLIPELTALENVELPLDYRGAFVPNKRALAEAALERVGMGGRLMHHPNEMSGGQQQRVAIARAIVTDPPLILADEPTGNLDSKTTADVIAILRGLHAAGATVVLITHDNEIARTADRTVRVLDGRIVHDSAIDGREDI